MTEESKSNDGNAAAGSPRKDTAGAGNKKPQGKVSFTPRTPKFEGKCDALKGHIYDSSDARQSDQYMKTTKEIAEYVGRTFKYGGDARTAVETLETPTVTLPPDPAPEATRGEVRLWEKAIDEQAKRTTYLTENMKTLYSLVWGQCSDIIRQKVEAQEGFGAISSTGDGLGLLRALKGVAYQFQSQKYLLHSLQESMKRYYNCSQGKFANNTGLPRTLPKHGRCRRPQRGPDRWSSRSEGSHHVRTWIRRNRTPPRNRGSRSSWKSLHARRPSSS